MKKIIILCCIVLSFTILTVGCSANKPENVAAEYISGATELNFDKIEANSIVSHETIFMAQVNAFMENSQKTEAEVWETLAKSYEFDETPKNYDEYKKSLTAYAEKEMKSQYGDDFEVKVSVIASEEKSESEIKSILSEASDYYDTYHDIIISDIISFADIKECKEVTCKIYLSGEKVEEDESIEECSVYVVKVAQKWKVLNLGISY